MTAPDVRRRRLLVAAAIVVPLLACAVLAGVERPWLSPWWPGRHEAAALPRACPGLPGLPAPGTPGALTQRDDDGTLVMDGAECTWGTPPEHEAPPLNARYWLYHRVGAHSGTELAESQAGSLISGYDGPSAGFEVGADTPIAGVGDEARITDHGGLVVLAARKANVVIVLQYHATGPEAGDQSQTRTATYARTLLGGVALN